MEYMKYIDVNEASIRWGISDRRIRLLCNEGRIDGAIKLGWSWAIPDDTPKPRDGRVLRHFKNMDIRPGFVDQDALDGKLEAMPLTSDYAESEEFSALIADTIEFLLDMEGTPLRKSDIDRILSGKMVSSLKLSDHLVVLNFRSCMINLAGNREKWTEKDVRMINARLMQGIDDYHSSDYREGLSDIALRGKVKLAVAPQMETIFAQYESWSELEPLVRAVMLFGEVKRCKPFDGHPEILAYLILAGELMASGMRPPHIKKEDRTEAESSAFIAYARGNYKDLTAFIESRVNVSYGEEVVRNV